MSAAARAKIAAAQRARWAKQKGNAAPKSAKTAAKKSAGGGGDEPSGPQKAFSFDEGALGGEEEGSLGVIAAPQLDHDASGLFVC